MMTIKTKYVTRVPSVKREMEMKASALVRWGAFALQGYIRVQIIGFGAVDTGFMLGSVSVNILGTKRALVYVGADYGHFVNNGTSKMAARPFFDTGVSMFVPQWQAAVKSL